MFNIEDFKYTFQRIKYLISYSGFKLFMHVLACIFVGILPIIFGVLYSLFTGDFEYRGVVISVFTFIYLLLAAIVIIETIFVIYQRKRTIYYIDEKAYNFVHKYNGRWIFIGLSLLTSILISLLRSSIGSSNLLISFLAYSFDIYYLYEHHKRSENIYKNGNVYKFVIEGKVVKVYYYSDEDVLLNEFTF